MFRFTQHRVTGYRLQVTVSAIMSAVSCQLLTEATGRSV